MCQLDYEFNPIFKTVENSQSSSTRRIISIYQSRYYFICTSGNTLFDDCCQNAYYTLKDKKIFMLWEFTFQGRQKWKQNKTKTTQPPKHTKINSMYFLMKIMMHPSWLRKGAYEGEGCFGISKKSFPSVAIVSQAFCHPLLTAVASNTHGDDFPGGQKWGGPWLPPSSTQCSTRIGCCDEGNAALLSKIPFPSLHRHGCRHPWRSQTQEHSAGSSTLHQWKLAMARLGQHSHSLQTFCGLLFFLNKSWEGEEFHSSGHALSKLPWAK